MGRLVGLIEKEPKKIEEKIAEEKQSNEKTEEKDFKIKKNK